MTPEETIDHLRQALQGCRELYDQKWDEEELLRAYCLADEIESSLFWLFRMNGLNPPWGRVTLVTPTSEVRDYWSNAELAKRVRHIASKLEVAQ